jgi:hypothetical protein
MLHFLPSHIWDLGVAATEYLTDLSLAGTPPTLWRVGPSGHEPNTVIGEVREDAVYVVLIKPILNFIQ